MEIPGWRLSRYGSPTTTLHYTKKFDTNLLHTYIDIHDSQIKRYHVYCHITPTKMYDNFIFSVDPPLQYSQKNIKHILNISLKEMLIKSL